MSKKKYMEGRNQALEQIIQELQNQIKTKDFIIEQQGKASDRHVLTLKFIVDILLLTSQLEKILADNTVLSDALRLAITTFKVELSKAIQTIVYDGGDSYTFDTSINNCIDKWNDEEEE